MPPAVIDAMSDFRAALDRADRDQSTRMAQVWLSATQGLDAEFERLATEVANAASAGRLPSQWHLSRMQRYQSLMRQIAERIVTYQRVAGAEVTEAQWVMARHGISHSQQLIAMQLPSGVTGQFDRLPVTAVENMVGIAGNGAPLGRLLRDSFADAAPDVATPLIRGVALGWHPTRIARAMRDATNITLERALVIARHEPNRVYREASRQQYIESDVVEGYIRVASKSARTCMACLLSDGEFYPLNVPFEEHVNGRCLTPGTIVSGPVAESFVSRHYVGEVVEITTASGEFLSVTPNHPILTDRGWVAAQFLKEGDHVVSSGDSEWIASGMNPNEYQIPIAVEDIPRALNMDRLILMPSTSKNFHGDGMGSDVYVVWANRFLRDKFDAAVFEPCLKHGFGGGYMCPSFLSGFGNLDTMLKGLLLSARGFLRDLDASLMFFGGGVFGKEAIGFGLGAPLDTSGTQTSFDDLARNTIGRRQSIFRFTRRIAGDHFFDGDWGIGEDVPSTFLGFDSFACGFVPEQAASLEFIRESLLASVKSSSGVLRAIASNVGLDRILKVKRVQFSGHVYNLQTAEQWYIANGIITHNCTSIPQVKGAPRITYETGEQWFLRQDAATQREMMGPGRYDAWRQGRFALGDLVTRHHNDVWGNSLQVTPLRVLLNQPSSSPVIPLTPTPAPTPPAPQQPGYAFPHDVSPQQRAVVDSHVMQQIQRYASAHGLSEAEVLATVERTMSELLEDVPVSMRFQYHNFPSLQSSQRFMSQFETGSSGGALDTRIRAEAEEKGLGYPQNIAPIKRPVYGYFDTNQGDDAAYWYGGLQFVFKDEVKRRATFTLGDSLGLFLNDYAYGTPALAPRIGAADTAIEAIMGYARNQDKDDFLSGVALGYIEAQVHGTASLNEVEYVIDHNMELTKADRDWLHRRGIDVR